MVRRANADYALTAHDDSAQAFRSFEGRLNKTEARIARFNKTAAMRTGPGAAAAGPGGVMALTGGISGAAIGGVGVVAALTKVVGAVQRVTDRLDEMKKSADDVGVSMEFLSAMEWRAEDVGVAFDRLTPAFGRLQKAIADAAGGTKRYAELFQELGLDVDKLADAHPDMQILAVADALDRLKPASNEAFRALSKTDQKLIEFFENLEPGRAARLMGELSKESRKLVMQFAPPGGAEAALARRRQIIGQELFGRRQAEIATRFLRGGVEGIFHSIEQARQMGRIRTRAEGVAAEGAASARAQMFGTMQGRWESFAGSTTMQMAQEETWHALRALVEGRPRDFLGGLVSREIGAVSGLLTGGEVSGFTSPDTSANPMARVVDLLQQIANSVRGGAVYGQ